MPRQTTEKSLDKFLKVANHPLCYWVYGEVRRHRKDVKITLQAARRVPDIWDGLPIDITVEMSVRSLIEKRWPKRKRKKGKRK